MSSTADFDKVLFETLDKGPIENSRDWCQVQGWTDHQEIVGLLKSWESMNTITCEFKTSSSLVLTADGEDTVANGSLAYKFFVAIPAEGISAKDASKVDGFKQCSNMGWLNKDKGMLTRKTETVEDPQKLLSANLSNLTPDQVKTMRGAKLVQDSKVSYCRIAPGEKYNIRKKDLSDLTAEMLKTESWKEETFKFNVNALGAVPDSGFRHPLNKVKAEFKQIFLDMGFEEMPTNNFVENSFWNFDALFQPQQHPARDSHDTFFLKDPATSHDFTDEYLAKVKMVHSEGGYGSLGWRYDWKLEEAEKNILRTHTTAVSSRMLYKLAQTGFKPKKYFSVDRVFRNETLDATHLAEFHQVEGVIADVDISLSHLIGMFTEFFKRLGISNISFKPAYNPYTEPSMEIFGIHPKLGRVELGNSGIFRPEMLLPMGLPENVRVAAWGLSLERPTMIKYGLDNIRDIFGNSLNVNFIKTNPICMFPTSQ
eukprot:gene13698-16141_t